MRLPITPLLVLALSCFASGQNYTVATFAGDGTPAYSGDTGPAVNAQLNSPFGVAVDSAGNVYIADSNNHRVRKVSKGVITTVAGTGTAGYSGDNGPATGAELFFPRAVAVDTTGNLYIADWANSRIRKVSNGVITTVAGNGTISFDGDNGNNGPATSASIWRTESIAVDSSGSLYLAEFVGQRVRKVANGVIVTVAGGGTVPGDNIAATSAYLGGPSGVAVDSSGNLYIADYIDAAIYEVSNGVITRIAGNGTNHSGDGGPAAQAGLSSPWGIALDSSDNIYSSEFYGFYGIREISNGMIATIAGNGTAGFSGDGGPAARAQLDQPAGIAVDSAGRVYVADTKNNRIRVLTPSASPAVPQVNAGGVLNLASYAAPVVAGSIAAVYGSFFVTSVSNTDLPLDTSLENLSLQFGAGEKAPLFFVSGGEVGLQVPWELAGQSTTTVAATLNSQTGATQTVSLAPYAPAIFAINSQGVGQGAILDSSYNLVDSSHPATAGTTIVLIYCTGLGAVTNQPATGSPGPSGPIAWTITPPTVSIGGLQASVLFSGLAPGFVGLYQVNALVPAGVTANSTVPVVISMDGVNSNTVTIAVR